MGNLGWMAAGATVFLAVVLVAMHFDRGQDVAAELAWQSARIEGVDRMSVALESAAEAEKSAVMAITDEDSVAYADQARAASATVERERQALEAGLRDHGTPAERDLLAKFGVVFADFRRVDDEILPLAVQNTNLKAYALAYGPAADALRDTGAALEHLVTDGSASPRRADLTAAALGAEVAALRVQALLPPHIAEEDDGKMASLEAQMGGEEGVVRKDLDALAALGAGPLVDEAVAGWARFLELKGQILALSHANTNVRSLAISLRRKRQVTAACQSALDELRDAIKAEPIAGADRVPALPR